MPLLYVNQLASIERLALDPDLDGRIKSAVEREMTRENSSGAFGLWTADAGADDLWLDAFVTDFLTRARERGFAVPQLGFDNALDHLRNEVVNAADPSEGAGEPLAYALYVLARNGRPVILEVLPRLLETLNSQQLQTVTLRSALAPSPSLSLSLSPGPS